MTYISLMDNKEAEDEIEELMKVDISGYLASSKYHYLIDVIEDYENNYLL